MGMGVGTKTRDGDKVGLGKNLMETGGNDPCAALYIQTQLLGSRQFYQGQPGSVGTENSYWKMTCK